MRKVLIGGLLLIVAQVFSTTAQTLIGYQQKGRASYYATKFEGRRTSSGEIYQNEELTAAHRTLPFNTLLKVTNVANGKEVIVRVNDRGPFSKNKILDLSQAAAGRLDMVRAGVANVTIEVVGVDNMVANLPAHHGAEDANHYLKARTLTPQPAKVNHAVTALPGRRPASDDKFVVGNSYSLWGTSKNPTGYGVQVAAYEDLTNAKDLCKELIAKKQETVFISVEPAKGKKLYRVLAGTFNGRREAQQYLSTLEGIGYEGIICRHTR